MSYPKQVRRFIEWSKLMVAGATVDREATKGLSGKKTRSTKPTRRRRRKRKKHSRRMRDG